MAVLLAFNRRGPLAHPTEEEMYEHLLCGRADNKSTANSTKDPLAGVLAFQWRTHAMKDRPHSLGFC